MTEKNPALIPIEPPADLSQKSVQITHVRCTSLDIRPRIYGTNFVHLDPSEVFKVLRFSRLELFLRILICRSARL